MYKKKKGEDNVKEKIMAVIKGTIVAYIVSGLMILIFALLMYYKDLSEDVVKGGIIFVRVISCFISGIFVSKVAKQGKFLWGLLAGFVYFAILVLVAMIWGQKMIMDISGIWSTLFLCVFGGMLGGMLCAAKKN